jgi:hypothetical protein
MSSQWPTTAVLAAAIAAVLAACGSDGSGTSTRLDAEQQSPRSDSETTSSRIAPTESPRVPETPLKSPDPANYTDVVDNPYRPMMPGSRWVHLTTAPDEKSRIISTILDRSRVVQDVTCIVVHVEERTLEGVLVEDTYDWYAQDLDGNVWYFGEDTTAYEDGQSSTKGSWEAGVDGAQAGIIMLADPRVGDVYQQEAYAGEAEDQGEVLAVNTHIPAVPARYGGLLKTEDTTPLEPNLVEHKYYARGIGLIYEETVKGGREVVTLISMKDRG